MLAGRGAAQAGAPGRAVSRDQQAQGQGDGGDREEEGRATGV